MRYGIDIKKAEKFIGTKRQKLTAIKFLRKSNEKTKSGDQMWLFKCDCGLFKEKSKGNFMLATTNNCGCIRPHKIHGGSIRDKKGHQRPMYRKWVMMRQRCNNKNNPDYHFYGGRGIKQCERWKDFKNFYEDMGKSYEEHSSKFKDTTLDRIDVNGDYSPENCRWATRREQSNNRNYNVPITYRNKSQSAGNWVKELGLKMTARNLYKRVFTRRWDIERAFSQKARQRSIKNKI